MRMENVRPISPSVADPSACLVDTIRRALAKKDLDAFADLYAERAVLEELSQLDPPSHPHLAEGREAINERLHQEILHDPVSGWARQLASIEVTDAIETDDAIAFTEVRTYAAGDKVIAQHLARKADGRILRDRVLLVWDSQ
ncbi:hypothetical protein [Chondromyces crocatus]|nr:hypothetical protein [Chondromyces crocatus]